MNDKSEIKTIEQPIENFWFNNPRVLFVITLFMFIGVLMNLMGPVTTYSMVMLFLMFGLLVINAYRFIDRLLAEINRKY